MSTKHNSACLQKAADDEPIFVLRAQDFTAPEVIIYWAEKNKKTLTPEKYEAALRTAKEMMEWHTRKLPD